LKIPQLPNSFFELIFPGKSFYLTIRIGKKNPTEEIQDKLPRKS